MQEKDQEQEQTQEKPITIFDLERSGPYREHGNRIYTFAKCNPYSEKVSFPSLLYLKCLASGLKQVKDKIESGGFPKIPEILRLAAEVCDPAVFIEIAKFLGLHEEDGIRMVHIIMQIINCQNIEKIEKLIELDMLEKASDICWIALNTRNMDVIEVIFNHVGPDKCVYDFWKFFCFVAEIQRMDILRFLVDFAMTLDIASGTWVHMKCIRSVWKYALEREKWEVVKWTCSVTPKNVFCVRHEEIIGCENEEIVEWCNKFLAVDDIEDNEDNDRNVNDDNNDDNDDSDSFDGFALFGDDERPIANNSKCDGNDHEDDNDDSDSLDGMALFC